MTEPNITPLIPDLVFTVAITGHQDIPAAQHAALQAQITGLLETIRARICTACEPGHPVTNPVDAGRATSFRFVTALAPGADQIGARAALATTRTAPDDPHRWQLNVVLPFARATYQRLALDAMKRKKMAEAAIAPAIDAIGDLADQAERILELADWEPGADAVADDLAENDRAENDRDWESRRYATLGQMLVRQADLLIALWDGKPSRGPGGTADVVSEARRSGVPVVWINPEAPDTPHSFVPDAGSSHLPASDIVVRNSAGDDRVANLLISGETAALNWAARHVLLSGDGKRANDRAAFVRRFVDDEPSVKWRDPDSPGDWRYGDRACTYGLMLFWALRLPMVRGDRGEPLRRYPLRRAQRLDGRIAWPSVALYRYGCGVASGIDPEIDRFTANAAVLGAYAERADAIATRRSNHYRSAYILIFALAPVAVLLAVLSALWPDYKPWFVIGELVSVALAFAIYSRTNINDPTNPRSGISGWMRRAFNSQDTHQRWLDARLIAESQRSGHLLAWIGFAGRRPVEDQPEPSHGVHDDAKAHAHDHPARTVWAPSFANAIAALPNLPTPDPATPRRAAMTPPRIARLADAAQQVIEDQRSFHHLNHRRLLALHHRLDGFSLWAIVIAFGLSLAYLAFYLAVYLPLHPSASSAEYRVYHLLKVGALLGGAVLPALAAAAAGIRYHGDFERFAMRSQNTAEQLTALATRANHLEQRARRCGDIGPSGAACAGQPPLFEPLLGLLVDTHAVLDEDLADWRFAYAARPITMG